MFLAKSDELLTESIWYCRLKSHPLIAEIFFYFKDFWDVNNEIIRWFGNKQEFLGFFFAEVTSHDS